MEPKAGILFLTYDFVHDGGLTATQNSGLDVDYICDLPDTERLAVVGSHVDMTASAHVLMYAVTIAENRRVSYTLCNPTAA